MYTTDDSRNDHPHWWAPGTFRFVPPPGVEVLAQ